MVGLKQFNRIEWIHVCLSWAVVWSISSGKCNFVRA